MLPDGSAARAAAAARLAELTRLAVDARGRCVIAVSGGTSVEALTDLARLPAVGWPRVVFVQADERIAPDGDEARNLTHQLRALAPALALGARLAPMAAGGDLPDSERIGRSRRVLQRAAGTPPVVDIAQLGLGADGHTASLVPDDPVLGQAGDVALSGQYRGHRRLTLTLPALSRARRRVWVVTGEEKAEALQLLLSGDDRVPAGRVNPRASDVFADVAAAPG